MNIGSQEIGCSVQSCKHNKNASYCNLNRIMVGEASISAQTQDETLCASFEAK